MSRGDGFFHFKLCLLRVDDDFDSCLKAIIAVGTGHLASKLTYCPQSREINWRAAYPAAFDGLETDKALWLSHKSAAARLGMGLNSIDELVICARGGQDFIDQWESRNGRDPYVRIKAEWTLGTLFRRRFAEIDFRVVCALYSMIGDKETPVPVSRTMARMRSRGLKSARVMVAEGIEESELDTEKRVRSAITRNHRRKCFSRVSTENRSYYQHLSRMNDEELADSVYLLETARYERKRCAARTGTELRLRLQAERRGESVIDLQDPFRIERPSTGR